MTDLPLYQSRSTVRALKIKRFEAPPLGSPELAAGSAILVPEDEGFEPFAVSAQYVEDHHPQPGGYYVVFEAGYATYTPAHIFEYSYVRI
jgi:hypothetical protein